MSTQPSERQFIRKAAIIAICGGISLAAVTVAIEAYDAAFGSKSGHGGWSTLLSMLIRIPGYLFLVVLRLDHAFSPKTRFWGAALSAIANGVCVAAIVLAFAVFLLLCRRALGHGNRAG